MACPLCKQNSAAFEAPHTRTFSFQCENCGKFQITDLALAALKERDELAFDLGSWVYLQNREGVSPLIRETDVQQFKTRPRPNVDKRAELYLGAVIESLNGALMGRYGLANMKIRIAGWCSHPNDSTALGAYLQELGALQDTNTGQDKLLTAKGHLVYERMTAQRTSQSQAFVAMWFDPSVHSAYTDGIEIAIRSSGFDPIRIDKRDFADRIDDQIIAEIRRSRFIVADFTGNRGGVYYEAEFAHGLEKKVLFTCRKSDEFGLHFDVEHYNVIFWTQPNEIVKPLQNRILALFGAGPLKPDAKPLP